MGYNLKERILTPELLDDLPHDDPTAKRSRMDLRRINFLMGNHRILHRQLRNFPWSSLREWGAGDGRFLQRLRCRYRDSVLTGIDLIPRPAGLDRSILWHQGDVLHCDLDAPDVVIANLFLHHFSLDQLPFLGTVLARSRVILSVEPHRSLRAMSLSLLLQPFVNSVTRHDMRVSIEAGFRPQELPIALGLSPEIWDVHEFVTMRGAIVMIATKR